MYDDRSDPDSPDGEDVETASSSTRPPRTSRLAWAGLLVALLIGASFRINAGLFRDLWEDEIIAVTHAVQPFWQVFSEVLRSDVHPPLYFLQLHLWGELGASDLWFKLNSVAWSIVAIGLMFITAGRLYGPPVGVIAAALLALFPPAVWMAQEVRPYSWLYCLLIGAFYSTETALRRGFESRILVPLTVICIAIVYTHALGFLIVFLLGIYAFISLLEMHLRFKAYGHWAIVFGLAAISAVPPLAVDMLRDANLGVFGLDGTLAWIPRMVLPRGDGFAVLLPAALVTLGVVVAGLEVRSTRLVTAVFLVLPLVLSAVLQALGHEIYKQNIFGTISGPFLVLVIAKLTALARPPVRRALVLLTAVLFTLGSIQYIEDRVPTTGYLAAARMIENDAQPGDVVYVPQRSMFLGMAHYMVGVRWGSPLRVAGTPDAPWRRMYNRLGPGLVRLLGWEPVTQTLQAPDGLTLLVGNDSLPQAMSARRVWLVTLARNDLPAGFPPPAIGSLRVRSSQKMNFLDVTLYQ